MEAETLAQETLVVFQAAGVAAALALTLMVPTVQQGAADSLTALVSRPLRQRQRQRQPQH